MSFMPQQDPLVYAQQTTGKPGLELDRSNSNAVERVFADPQPIGEIV